MDDLNRTEIAGLGDPGFSIPPYRIVRHIGSGAMGDVYEAFDESLERRTALKLLAKANFAAVQVDDLIQRQIREARMAAKVSHPNLVSVFAAGEHDGRHFIAMEFVDGRSLHEVITLADNRRLPADQALDCIEQAALGLRALHDAHIIHRDIKPANLLLDSHGTLRVTDFGLARPIQSDNALSMVGTVVGTVPYLPPEQCEADEVDQRADIYALGVTLHQMITGELPFSARTLADLRTEFRKGGYKSAIGEATSLGTPLRKLIERMTAHSAADRFQNCDELIAGIRACRAELGLPVSRHAAGAAVVHVAGLTSRQRNLARLAVNVLVVAVAAVAAVALGNPGQSGIAGAIWHTLRDAHYFVLPEPPTNGDVSIVGLEKWPLDSAEQFAAMIDAIAAREPAVIVLDFLMDENGSRLPNPEQLATAFERAGNVVMAADLRERRIVPPLEALAPHVRATGFAALPADWDARVRNATLRYTDSDGAPLNAVSAATVNLFAEIRAAGSAPEFPTAIVLNYAALDHLEPIRIHPDRGMLAEKPDAALEVFRDRIVLVGTVQSDDQHRTARFDDKNLVPGVLVQAVAIDNLLNRSYFTSAPIWLTAIIYLIVAAAAVFAGRRTGLRWIGVTCTAAGALFMLVVVLNVRIASSVVPIGPALVLIPLVIGVGAWSNRYRKATP